MIKHKKFEKLLFKSSNDPLYLSQKEKVLPSMLRTKKHSALCELNV